MTTQVEEQHFYRLRWTSVLPAEQVDQYEEDDNVMVFIRALDRTQMLDFEHWPTEASNTGKLWLTGIRKNQYTYVAFVKSTSEQDAKVTVERGDANFETFTDCSLADDYWIDGVYVPKGDRFL